MALRAETMSNPITSRPEPPLGIFLRKLLLLILLMVVAVLGILVLLIRIKTVPYILMLIVASAIMGLTAGFSARWVLRTQGRILRLFTALGFLIGGLSLLGQLTGGKVGIGLLRESFTVMDWLLSLGQLLLGTSIALLALYTWTHPLHVPAPAPKVKGSRPPLRPKKQPKKPIQSRAKPRVSSRTPHRTARPAPVKVTGQPGKPKHKRIYRRKPQLQLSDEKEHRCPYCLELIDLNDPRGTVECKVCHTLHHADCWAITGACQVPHYNA